MIVDTRRLFLRLLRTFEIATVCDVGSMDGSDALRFRRALPTADILALEPNPRNYALMAADENLRRRSIRSLPLAAGDRNFDAPFYVPNAEYAVHRDRARRGIGSMYRRFDGALTAEAVQVRGVRLDELLTTESLAAGPLAIWIDTEGMAFEVVSGARGVLEATRMLHVEAETEPLIATEQKLFADVEQLLSDAGFVVLATDQPRSALQFNALFVRTELLRTNALEIRRHVRAARAHRVLKSLYRATTAKLRPFVPRLGAPETRVR